MENTDPLQLQEQSYGSNSKALQITGSAPFHPRSHFSGGCPVEMTTLMITLLSNVSYSVSTGATVLTSTLICFLLLLLKQLSAGLR